MKYWTQDEMFEIEEELLRRKATVEYTPEKLIKEIEWEYKDWEHDLIEDCAEAGYAKDAVEKFLHRGKSDLLRYVRNLGYANWDAYCETVQYAAGAERKRLRKVKYKDIVETALGRHLTKDEMVHHVNCDHEDDVLKNLWVCDRANHVHAHKSYRDLIKSLIAYGVISFDRKTGNYSFDADSVEAYLAENPMAGDAR